MAERHVITALVKLRARVAGELTASRKRQVRLEADLVHIDAVIRLFSDTIDPEAIRATRIQNRFPWFLPGEVKEMALDILREAAEPMRTMDIAARILATKGLDAEDWRTKDRVRQYIIRSLKTCRIFQSETRANRERWWRLAD